MKINPVSQPFFEQKYQQQQDPWAFATSQYEQARYDAVVHALAHRRYRSAFEPGCSIGILTARLAAFCDQVHAVDISPTAVRHARKRCSGLPNVTIACGAAPRHIPAQSLDLIVLSEIGYYFDEQQLRTFAASLIQRLQPSGILLAAHWLGYSQDHILSGDQVHSVLGTLDGLTHEHAERHAGFRLDRWTRSQVRLQLLPKVCQ